MGLCRLEGRGKRAHCDFICDLEQYKQTVTKREPEEPANAKLDQSDQDNTNKNKEEVYCFLTNRLIQM